MTHEDIDIPFLLKEISDLRINQSKLQIELERYQGDRKIIKILIKSWRKKIKTFYRQLGISKNNKEISPDFYLNNPDFKPYKINIKEKVGENRPKVLHVIACFTTGGSQQLVVDLIERLGHLYEQQVMIRHHPGPQGYIGIPVTEFSIKKPNWEKQIYLYLKKLQPDIVHIHYWGNYTNNYEEWRWYNQVFLSSIYLGFKVIENCNNPSTPYFHPKINKYIYVSKYAEVAFGVPDKRNTVIYPGSDFSLFTNDSGFIEKENNCIGMVYRLDRDKLDEKSIEVFIEVIKRRKQTKALIIGGGYYFEYYKKRVQEEGLNESFIFTGYVSYTKLPYYYQRMTVFVAPVHKESFGQVTPFAMSMGIPVVGYKVGALPEILDDISVLAEKGNVSELSNIIIRLLERDVERMKVGRRNKEKAQQFFSVDNMIVSYKDIYLELLNTNLNLS